MLLTQVGQLSLYTLHHTHILNITTQTVGDIIREFRPISTDLHISHLGQRSGGRTAPFLAGGGLGGVVAVPIVHHPEQAVRKGQEYWDVGHLARPLYRSEGVAGNQPRRRSEL